MNCRTCEHLGKITTDRFGTQNATCIVPIKDFIAPTSITRVQVAIRRNFRDESTEIEIDCQLYEAKR